MMGMGTFSSTARGEGARFSSDSRWLSVEEAGEGEEEMGFSDIAEECVAVGWERAMR